MAILFALPPGTLFAAGVLRQVLVPSRPSAALQRLLELRPVIASFNAKAEQLVQDSSDLLPSATGEPKLVFSTRFSPLAGDKLEHFAGFLDGPLRELDYSVGVYEALHAVAVGLCSDPDPYLTTRPVPVRKNDGTWELDLAQPDTQRCLGNLMGLGARRLGILASNRAGLVVRALARRELAASLGSSREAERLAATADWSWLGPAPDLRSAGSMGIALKVLLAPGAPCTPGATERLCIAELSFEQFMDALAAAGYVPESKTMRAAMDDRGQWIASTLQKGLDRAGTIEIKQDPKEQAMTRKAVNLGVGAGETVTRAAAREGGFQVQLDPSTVPTQPLADGSYLPIVLAHLVPYRVALDVVGGGLALSWLEPRIWLSKWFSIDTTLQLVNIQFSSGMTSTTLGARGIVHLGPVGVGAGPRWSLNWSGSDASSFGAEFDVTFLQGRFGVSFGFQNITSSGWNTPFVALTIADLNGALYWLIPAAWRSGR